MFRDKLNVSADEPYDTNYDYEEMKSTRMELHKEFKKIYRLFKKSLTLTYAPIATLVETKQ